MGRKVSLGTNGAQLFDHITCLSNIDDPWDVAPFQKFYGLDLLSKCFDLDPGAQAPTILFHFLLLLGITAGS
jgi:hypothetical protein